MGAVVELGVDSDTRSLQFEGPRERRPGMCAGPQVRCPGMSSGADLRSASREGSGSAEGGTRRWDEGRLADAARRMTTGRAHPTRRARAAGVLFALAIAGGCGSGALPPPDPAAPQGDRARAEALLDPAAPLPSRAEAVALSDALAITSHREGRTLEGARLALLAGDLRARLWRMDQSATDAREALELYAASVLAAGASELACDADLRRALLAGELGRDASATYRELYLASRRQAAVGGAKDAPSAAAPSPSARAAGSARARCLAEIDLALAQAVAFRPSRDAMRALEREGNLTADASLRALPSAPPLLAASAEATPARAVASAAAPSAAGDVVVSPSEDAVAKGPVKIVGVEPFGGEDAARVVLRLSAPATFQVGALGADGSAGKDARIFVDVARAGSKGLARETPVGGVVRRVRLGAHEGGTRVVLDLAGTVFRRVFYLPDPFRIVIDVSTRAPGAPGKIAEGGGRDVRRVAIDPGHGGNDSGAVGPTGLREKDVTLDIAHRVAPLLAHELKVETLLTRDNDTYVPLDLRAARANAFHADLFVSIHCNASENAAARGVQTFILDEARDPEGYAARVAARENAQRGSAEVIAPPVLTNLAFGDLPARSRHVADLLQRASLSSLAPRWPDTRDQGVKTAGFFVLVGADMPAVLFETAFISNTDDEQRLATADYRQKLADAIANAIRAYKAGK